MTNGLSTSLTASPFQSICSDLAMCYLFSFPDTERYTEMLPLMQPDSAVTLHWWDVRLKRAGKSWTPGPQGTHKASVRYPASQSHAFAWGPEVRGPLLPINGNYTEGGEGTFLRGGPETTKPSLLMMPR